MKRGILFIMLLLFACIGGFYYFKSHKKNHVHPAFYYWKSVYKIDTDEQRLLDTLHVKKMYLKYFDVTWNTSSSQPEPAATIKFSTAVDNTSEIIPVVFIVNDVFKKCDTQQVNQLALNVSSLLKKISETNIISVKEIQFDCDWSDATREKYFSFLKKVKSQLQNSVFLSATIRLHQIKYYKRTGIPPVQRGMLMFYNMGQLKNPLTDNSIFDEKAAAKYIDYVKSYPLPLDYALPVFTWGVHIRNNKVIGLENNIAAAELDSMHQLKLVSKNIYSVQDDFFFHGTYFLKEDMIRIEEVTPALALQAAKILSSETNNHDFTVSLFHLDSSNTKRYAIEDFENIYNSFN